MQIPSCLGTQRAPVSRRRPLRAQCCGRYPAWSLDRLAQFWWTSLGTSLLVRSHYWSQNHCLSNCDWMVSSSFPEKRPDIFSPAASASVVPDLKPPLWPDRSPALLIPAPEVFRFQPLQPPLLKLHLASPSINLTGYSLPNPSWDWAKRRGLGWETEKAFMFLALLQANLSENCCFIVSRPWAHITPTEA